MYTEQGRKQHLNLSCTAYEVIQSDLHAFGQSSLSGFLNGVFRSYYESADASVELALNRKRHELLQILKPLRPELCAQTCELLLKHERETLVQKVKSYPKGIGFKFYLNAENANIIEENTDFIREYYHSHPALFLKAVIEEYATYPAMKRESIFFGETIDLLERCIEGHYLLSIETGGKRFEVKPWSIVADESRLYQYFVGLSNPVGTDSTQAIPASFRIARMTAVKKRPKSYRSGKLTLFEEDTLQAALQERGVAFLVGSSEEITLKLTPEGQRLYQNKLFLRPYPTHVERIAECESVYTFHCTPYQIQSYFLSFGAEVEILSPSHLRDRFKRMLQQAYQLYE